MPIVRFDDYQAFRFRGGRACLNLVATLGRRYDERPVERIPERGDLARWLVEAGLAGEPPRTTANDLRDARELREALWRLSRTVLDGDRLRSSDLRTINALAARPIRAVALEDVGRLARVGAPTARLLIGEIATDGVDLFSGPEIERLKECARQDCGLLFVDRSHSGRRRWCDMEACGNRAKTSVYRARRRTSSPA